MPESRSVGEEISHLEREGPSRGPRKGQRYSHTQAVAAALSQQRRGKIGRGRRKRKARSRKR